MEEKIKACSFCGSSSLEQITPKTFTCKACGHSGEPLTFSKRSESDEFKQQRTTAQMRSTKLWGQKVIGRTIPIVVLVNWGTAVYYTMFFILGFIGYFSYNWFKWVFLYTSIAVVSLGFGLLVKWGRERITI